MDIIGALMVGAGLALVIDHPYMQWHYLLGVGVTILVVPRVLQEVAGAVRGVWAPKP